MRGKWAIAAVSAGAAVAASSLAVAAGPGQGRASALSPTADPTRVTVPELSGPAAVPAKTAAARADLSRSLGAEASLTVDDKTGGVKSLARLGGFLTAPSSADAADVALGYVRRNSAAFGMTWSELRQAITPRGARSRTHSAASASAPASSVEMLSGRGSQRSLP
jgi:hypothetical protein